MYAKGTIKIAWTTKGNYNELNSVMFDSLDKALSYSKDKKDFMIMELVENDGNYYKWKVLPYGDYTSYKYGMIISDNIVVFTALAALMGYGVYRIIRKK
jgi:hypothetical protein